MQEMILKRYLDLNGKQSYEKMARDLSINKTRLHRIFHGAEMKLAEYEKFANKIDISPGLEPKNDFKLLRKSKECLTKLSNQTIIEIENFINQKLQTYYLLEGK